MDRWMEEWINELIRVTGEGAAPSAGILDFFFFFPCRCLERCSIHVPHRTMIQLDT